MIDSGLFTLKTPQQLLEKLRRDYDHLRQNPTDADTWFNFIVTADHLPEWELAADEAQAGKLRKSEPLLRICHHLSRNAKHFKARERKTGGTIVASPVAGTYAASVVQLGSLGLTPEPTQRTTWTEFYLELSPAEAAAMGTDDVSAIEFAGRLVRFWRKRSDPTAPPDTAHPLEDMEPKHFSDDEAPA